MLYQKYQLVNINKLHYAVDIDQGKLSYVNEEITASVKEYIVADAGYSITLTIKKLYNLIFSFMLYFVYLTLRAALLYNINDNKL